MNRLAHRAPALTGLLLACAALTAPQAPAVSPATRALVVNALDDALDPPAGTVTLRAAIEQARPGRRITFAPGLDGGVIRLTRIGNPASALPGELFAQGLFQGYGDRNYGPSALYARKNLFIDASTLRNGITLAWDGDEARPARVLAVYGDLVLANIRIVGGHARAEPTGDPAQPYTLARGGAVAVWGRAALSGCTFSGNRVTGDAEASRDRGAFGGAIYGNQLRLTDCIVSGNHATGYGAAGGGVYSVGGAGVRWRVTALLDRCVLSGNRVTGQHAYGGGAYSDGGGPGKRNLLALRACTVARNVVEDHPGIDEPPGSQYYYRGGGVYMSNGSLRFEGCTVVENAVTGPAALFRGRPNRGGGGAAATIGNAHVVENLELLHSLVAGNTVGGAPDDLYTGSLLHFYSLGYNRVGRLDFSQMLVPIPLWQSLSRRHWPKTGDLDGLALEDLVDVSRATCHPDIVSLGVDAGQPAVLAYPPAAWARDQIPAARYLVRHLLAQYRPFPASDPVPALVVQKLRRDYGTLLGADFGAGLGSLDNLTFLPVASVWPAEPANAAWIAFWRGLDAELDGRLGAAGLDDAFWDAFRSDARQAGLRLTTRQVSAAVRLNRFDLLKRTRPLGPAGDIGAVEE